MQPEHGSVLIGGGKGPKTPASAASINENIAKPRITKSISYLLSLNHFFIFSSFRSF